MVRVGVKDRVRVRFNIRFRFMVRVGVGIKDRVRFGAVFRVWVRFTLSVLWKGKGRMFTFGQISTCHPCIYTIR